MWSILKSCLISHTRKKLSFSSFGIYRVLPPLVTVVGQLQILLAGY
jgi:hypothetical protein